MLPAAPWAASRTLFLRRIVMIAPSHGAGRLIYTLNRSAIIARRSARHAGARATTTKTGVTSAGTTTRRTLRGVPVAGRPPPDLFCATALIFLSCSSYSFLSYRHNKLPRVDAEYRSGRNVLYQDWMAGAPSALQAATRSKTPACVTPPQAHNAVPFHLFATPPLRLLRGKADCQRTAGQPVSQGTAGSAASQRSTPPHQLQQQPQQREQRRGRVVQWPGQRPSSRAGIVRNAAGQAAAGAAATGATAGAGAAAAAAAATGERGWCV